MPIWLKILVGCLLMAAVTVLLGIFGLQAQNRLGDLAVRMYDEAFMSVDFVRSAQTKFEVLRNTYAAAAQHQAAALPAATSERQRLVEQARGTAPPPPPPADADAAAMRDASGAVLDDLDVAIDRATSDHARAGAVALRSRIVGAVAPGAPAARALATLEALRPVFDDTVEAFAQDGFAYRTRAEALMLRSDRETRWAIGAGVGAAGVITVLLTWMIVPQVRRAARAAEAIAAGRLDTRIPTPRRPRWSETSRLLGSLAAMQAAIRGNLERIEALHAEEARSRAATMAQRRASLLEMADRVEQETRVAVDNFQAQTAAMRETAEAMAALAARSGDNAQTAAAAAAAAHDSVRQVAASTDALAGSTSAIGETVGRCNAVVRHAVELGRNTQGSIVALSEHVERIGRVAEMIADIAARTNLLALNATIEAARAGEAGRGFAVVAGEVKALAKQTTHSTQEIGTLIAEVRAATLATVDSVQQIGRTVDEINVVSGQITEAIDIQGAATAEIAGNVTQTSQAAEQLAQLIAEVAEHSEATMRRAGQIRGETLVLSDAVATLRLDVVRTIRSSSDEVDRRTWHRFPVDLAGRLETGTGAAAVPMRVRDLSEGGARLEAAADLAPGATGTLSVDGIDMKLPFEVRQIQHRAGTPMLHVMFVLNEAQRDALRGVPERLSQLEAPVARAA